MRTIASELATIVRGVKRYPPLPADSLCKRCDRIRLGTPGVEEALVERGIRGREGQPWACVCGQREEQLRKSRFAWANLPAHNPPRRFTTFVRRPGTERAWDAAWEVVDGKGPIVVVLSGDTGTGKTHLLEAIAHERLMQGARVRYEYVPDLFARLRATFSPSHETTTDEERRPALNAPLLLLDEIGLRAQPTQWEIEELTAIVDARIREGRPMVCATNLSREDLDQRFDPRLASRLLDRHTGTVRWVTFGASDYRRKGGL